MLHDERHCIIFTIPCSGYREYTLPREEGASQPKGWIQGNTKIWPVLEVATSYLHGKYGVEVRIIGSNKFVLNLDNDEQEIPEVQLEEYALKIGCERFCMPIKG